MKCEIKNFNEFYLLQQVSQLQGAGKVQQILPYENFSCLQ